MEANGKTCHGIPLARTYRQLLDADESGHMQTLRCKDTDRVQ